MTEFFKNDAKELQMHAAGLVPVSERAIQVDAFFNDVYACWKLGEMIYDEGRVPVTGAIKRNIFIQSFQELFNSWAFAGTFESYISFFKKVFGDDVEVVFTVPDPGVLEIDITTTGVELSQFVAREIVDDEYVFFDMITQDEADNLVFQTIKGFETTSELEAAVFTTRPNGIYTTVSLTIGE